jgi:MYXO-CTERM domain-containing protein
VIDLTSNVAYASLSAAIANSAANDVIALSAGSYVENFPLVTHSLTIEAVGGLAHLTTPQPIPLNGRAILEVPPDAGASLTVSGLELSGAVDPATNNNGAGILFEVGNGNLTVRNSWFHDNQEGILVGAANSYSVGGTAVTIDHSEFNNNGIPPGQAGSGFTHNIYVNDVARLTVSDSYFHDAIGGHEIKSRAQDTVIQNNRMQDQQGTASYAIDLPDGGVDSVTGNVIEKGINAQNRYAVHFSGEGLYAASSLTLSNNVFIGDRPGGTTALLNQSAGFGLPAVPATVGNNALYGIPLASLTQDNFGPPYDTVQNNVALSTAAPPLDTSHPFAVGEPASAWLLPVAMLATAGLRRIRRRRGRARARAAGA